MLFLVLVLYLFLLFRNWVFKAWEFFLNSFVFKGIKGVTLFRCHGLKTHRLSYLVPKVKLLALELIEESTAVAGRHLSLVSIAWGSSVFTAWSYKLSCHFWISKLLHIALISLNALLSKHLGCVVIQLCWKAFRRHRWILPPAAFWHFRIWFFNF